MDKVWRKCGFSRKYGMAIEIGYKILHSHSGMRLKLSYKLFGAFFLILVIVSGAMMLSRYIFALTFRTYIHQEEQEKLKNLVPLLQEEYRSHGSWDGLKGDPQQWQQLTRAIMGSGPPPSSFVTPPTSTLKPSSPSFENPPPNDFTPPPPSFEKPPPNDLTPPSGNAFPPDGPPPGGLPGVLLLDARHQAVVGILEPGDPRDAVAIEVDGEVVGWLGMRAHEPFESGRPAALFEHQARQLYLLGGVVIGLTAVIAFLFARSVLRPIHQLILGTRELSQRNFTVRIASAAGDELGQLAENFNAMAQTLENYEKMRLQWLTDISHELRTPLAILRGEVEALQDGVRKPTLANLASLHTEILGISRLVEDLHLLSMADSDRLLMNNQWICACNVLKTVIESYRTRMDQCRITVHTRLDTVQSVRIEGDADRLGQVFSNICENACKYVHPPGTLSISGQVDDHALTLRFQDSGPGVPEEALPRLFDRLYRVDTSRNRDSGGSGLGLSICRHIIENHGGRIWAQRSPQGGLAIEIQLPLARKKNLTAA
jgi:two-component system sensor histidine kinase BaeS